MTADHNNNTQAAIEAGARFAEPRNVPGFKPFVGIPEGMKIEHLERLLDPERPQRIKAHPKFDDADSLVAYFNRFKDADSTLLADIDSNAIRAVLDHAEAAQSPGTPETSIARPRYHDHLATFTAKHSLEWQTWVASSGKRMTQEAFAVFIEDNAPDIQNPSAIKLQEIVLNLEASGSAEFKSFKRLEDGSVSFLFKEEVNGTSNGVPFPKQFEVLLRPYVGCIAVPLVAKLRFRNDGGKLSLWYDLLRHEQVKRAAFDEIVEAVASSTSTVVLKGRPQ